MNLPPLRFSVFLLPQRVFRRRSTVVELSFNRDEPSLIPPQTRVVLIGLGCVTYDLKLDIIDFKVLEYSGTKMQQ